MRRFLIGTSTVVLAASLIGCSANSQPASMAGSHNAYAGGDGSFGEDPVNPGEHSRERFMNAVQASQQAPAQVEPSASTK